ncbi:MAG: class I SAM-dependent RNA methyltransferase [Verrucomicrobia bacterium]|nr:class I SAM-dependent RNA methyltransferase [Verrucomicrobiota bacterium]MCF7709070.1 class I SAM-dependent RNA methyltransferase [Verrucomicrobiota bacterium]
MRIESKPDKELKPGAIQTGVVEDIAFGGEGVVRIDEAVVFVPYVLIGEEVSFKIIEVKKNYARAELLRVLKKSLQRVRPVCRYFGMCGGCQYQHMQYAAQLELKRKQVTDIFQRIGKFTEPDVSPVIPCPSPYGYRNRIMVRAQWSKFKKDMNLGFLRPDSRLVLDIERCIIAEPEINEELFEARRNPPRRNGEKVALRLFPPDWHVPDNSFFQNNFALLPELIDVVRERLHNNRTRFLIDSYCGVGFFSIALADDTEEFLGIEQDRQAIRAARANAERKGKHNGRYVEGKTEEVLPQLWDHFPADRTCLLLDPPRTGCKQPTLDMIRRERPSQVIYISCHPATLARDVSAICENGPYELNGVVPLDMFPQTQHVECVVDLRIQRDLR